MSGFKLSKRSKKNLSGINESLIELVERVIKVSEHDFGIPSNGGFRTAEDQNALFRQVPKVTNCDGYRKKSYHQTGNAFDIFIYFEGKARWDCPEKYEAVWMVVKEQFEIMRKEGIFCKHEHIEWGGNWKRRKDIPHFQLKVRL